MAVNQKMRSFLGGASISIIAAIPAVLFLTLGPDAGRFSSLSSSVYNLGRIFALAGVTLFALNFVLSMRLRFLEEIFGGMDKVYLAHGITGGVAFLFILAHPVLITLGLIPEGITIAASYLIPGGILSLDLGIAAIILLISLMIATFFTKLRYHHWKFTHEFMGLIFALVLLHMTLVKTSVSVDSIFPGYYVFVGAIGAIGLSAFAYSLIGRKKIVRYAPYIIENIKAGKSTTEIELKPDNPKKKIDYKSGQFIFLRFHNKELTKEPHPFSIASKSGNEILKVIIKKSGDFTGKLGSLKKDEKVSVEGPYGKFNFRNFSSKEQIWLAGGIGITPFIGMIEELEEHPDYKVKMFYTFQENYVVDPEMLERIKGIKNLEFIPWSSEKRGYISPKDVLHGEKHQGKEFLICGPPAFKEIMVKGLKKAGVKKEKMHEEVFDLR